VPPTSCPTDLDARIAAALADVRRRIAAACARAGRPASSVALLGVTKGKGPDVVLAAARAGLLDFGENYAQELVPKAASVAAAGVAVRWHFIGGLQTNKVRSILPLVAGVQSVDRTTLVAELARRADPASPLPVFVEAGIAEESQKWGASPEDVEAVCRAVLAAPSLSLAGLMCVPPFDDDPERSRPWFRELRGLRDVLVARLGAGPDALAGLSMGMSADFEVAVEEGATVVRVGSALFGARA
jgi:pyridoxal phosphate enzyme (YggS family)